VSRALAGDGWELTLAGKSERHDSGHEYVQLDRDADGALAVAKGFDLVIDVIPFDARHAQQLLDLDAGALIAISSASVYADDEGRGLDEAASAAGFPDYPVPIPETQRTVEPADTTYSPKKVAMERLLLENGRVPAAIVRPCAIYGPGDRMAREWHFVKRALDRRPHVVLSGNGAGLFHTTAVENIGELVRMLADSPQTDVYNCGDPDPPTVVEIARAVGDAAGHSFREVLVPDPDEPAGQTPWSASRPLVVDMTKAQEELGYAPAATWADALPRQVHWLIEATRGRDWRDVLTRGAQYLQFDYDAEDKLVETLSKA
jgi:nucleoside-diphosphate-sugar epimerase